MARTVRDANLEIRTARSRLPTRGKPHYRVLEPGLHLGYRKQQTTMTIERPLFPTLAESVDSFSLKAKPPSVTLPVRLRTWRSRHARVEAERFARALDASVDVLHVSMTDPDFVGYIKAKRAETQGAVDGGRPAMARELRGDQAHLPSVKGSDPLA
jgi:hypothetical protein